MSAGAPEIPMLVGGVYLYRHREWIYHRDDGHGNALLWGLGSQELVAAPYSQLQSVARIRRVLTQIRQLSDYPLRHQYEALRRHEIISEFLLAPRSKEETRTAAKAIGCSLSTFSRIIERFVLNAYRVASLIPRYGQFGKKNARLKSDREEIIDNAIATHYLKQPGIRSSKLLKIISDICVERNLPVPSRETVNNRIKQLPPKDVVKAREGTKAAREMFRLHKGRMSHPGGPLHEVQIDHTQIDVFVVLPDGKRIRPWLTLAIDVYTRMVVGFFLSLDGPSAYSVGMCLYRVLTPREDWLQEHGITTKWPCFGRPLWLCSDNGRDFRGYNLRRIALDHDLNWAFRELLNTERGAYIESMMGTVALEMEVFNGATFGSLVKRKDYPSEAMATLTFQDVEKIFLHFIVEIYHNTEHRGLNNASPLGRWREYQETKGDRPYDPPIFHASEDLQFSLWPFFDRHIGKDGVSWQKISYSDLVLEDWVLRKTSSHPEGKHRFHYNPCGVRTIRWKHPVSGSYLPISARDTGALDCTQWERAALLGLEDERDKARVDHETARKGRKALQAIADRSKDLSLNDFRSAKRDTANYRKRQALEDELHQANTEKIQKVLSATSGSNPAGWNRAEDIWTSTLSFPVTNL